MIRKSAQRFVLCLKNDAYPVSLEARKIYRAIPDSAAAAKGFLRIVDESGEDYLYPAKLFVAVRLPRSAVKVFRPADSNGVAQ